MSKKTLITCTAGFIGSHLSELFVKHNFTVKAFVYLYAILYYSTRSNGDSRGEVVSIKKTSMLQSPIDK